MSTVTNNATNTNHNEAIDTQELVDFLQSYEYDANGNPRMVELEDGRYVSFEELESMEESSHE
ncbi:TPA: hypothetical protein NUX20_004110 [Escherichia coli]|nr:hypothetical protein [Escherichia coli]